MVSAVGSGGRVPVPDLVPLDRLQGVARTRYAGDGEEVFHTVASGALSPLPARHDGGAGLAVGLGRVREISRLQLCPRRVRGDLAALRLRPARHRISAPRLHLAELARDA